LSSDITPKIDPTPDSEKQDLKDRINKAVTTQKRPTVTVLSSLLSIEDELGYIPDEAISIVAEYNNSTINEVWGVASFYPNFRFDPPSKNTVEVCWGPSCHLVGATDVIKAVLDELELDGEGDTIDKIATFKFNTCLGACPQAPVMSINHRMYGKISAKQAKSHILELRKNINGSDK
tara:strand:+ start:77921 stop:78451 length:531 start_codon:yes stop_codon:yes gene_type:complete